MIIYCTKETRKTYDLKLPDQISDPLAHQLILGTQKRQSGNSLHEWGAKVFYFEYLKCLQLCNFASKFTIVIADVEDKEIKQIAEIIIYFLKDIYADNPQVLKLIDRYADDNVFTYFDKLTNRSIISSMNDFQIRYLEDGDRIYDFTEGNLIHTRVLNKEINSNYLVGMKVNGKQTYIYLVEKFAELLKVRYG